MRQPFVFRPFSRILLPMLLGMAACGPSNQELDRIRVQIPWADTSGNYSLQPIELKTLHKLSAFEGEAVQVKVDPFNGTGDKNSMTPHFRYLRTKEGILVPTNLESLQMATAYAHMERLMEMDKEVGSYQFLQWPRSVGILKDQTKTSNGGRLVNNAYYYSPKDMIVLAPYEKDDLPMTMNGGILAHEHFHAIFHNMILAEMTWESKSLLEVNLDSPEPQTKPEGKKTPEKKDSIKTKVRNKKSESFEEVEISETELNNKINVVIVRALNEGLADVWGWLYSGDENFIEPSLKELTDERTLSSSSKVIGNGLLPTDAWLRSRMIDYSVKAETEGRVGLSYLIGTYFSRMMRNVFLSTRTSKNAFKLSEVREESSLQERRAWAKSLIAMIPKMGAKIQKTVLAQKVLSVNFVSEVVEAELPETSQLCETLQHFWLQEPSEKQEQVCPQAQVTP